MAHCHNAGDTKNTDLVDRIYLQGGGSVELRHLKYFVAVAELGSLSKAAVALYVAQPPLSRQIKDLEDEVGVPLLIRSSRGVAVTAAGEAFLKEARATLDQAERSKFVARQIGSTEVHTLNIGFIPSTCHTLLPKLLHRLRQDRPDVEVCAREMLTAEQAQAMLAGSIDIGICRPPVDTSRLALVATLDDPFCLVLPVDHWLAGCNEVDLARTSQERFVSYVRDQARAFFDQTHNFCIEAGFQPNIHFSVTSTYAVIELVAAGCGIAIVPSSAVAFGSKSVVFRRLIKPRRPGRMVVIRRSSDTNPVVSIAVDVIASLFTELDRDIVQTQS